MRKFDTKQTPHTNRDTTLYPFWVSVMWAVFQTPVGGWLQGIMLVNNIGVYHNPVAESVSTNQWEGFCSLGIQMSRIKTAETVVSARNIFHDCAAIKWRPQPFLIYIYIYGIQYCIICCIYDVDQHWLAVVSSLAESDRQLPKYLQMIWVVSNGF